MKITYAPIVSDASGRMGGIVATRWRGISVMRRFVPPSNPRSATQLIVRNRFRNANDLYSIAPTNARLSWEQYARARAAIARNGLIAAMGALDNTDDDISNLNPYANTSGPAFFESLTITFSSGGIAFSDPVRIEPEGYVARQVGSFVIPDFDPREDQQSSGFRWLENVADTTPGGNTNPPQHTSLTGGDYLAGAFIICARPSEDNRTYIGRAFIGHGTVT